MLFLPATCTRAAGGPYTGNDTEIEILSNSMLRLTTTGDVEPEFRDIVNARIDKFYNLPCRRDFHALYTSLKQISDQIDEAVIEKDRLAIRIKEERANLNAFKVEQAENMRLLGGARDALDMLTIDREPLEQEYTTVKTRLDGLNAKLNPLREQKAGFESGAAAAKDKIAALKKMQQQLEARLDKLLKQTDENLQPGETSENEPEIQDVRNQLAGVKAEIVIETDRRADILAQIDALIPGINTLQQQVNTTNAALADVQSRLGAVKKEIQKKTDEIAWREDHDKKLERQITDTSNLLVDLEARHEKASKTANLVAPAVLQRYKAILSPYAGYDCPQGMIMVEGSYCIDKYEYPNVKGQLPMGNVTWVTAVEKCGSEGKRLCTTAEYALACAGRGCSDTPADYSAAACNLGLGLYPDIKPLPAGRAGAAPGAAPACDSPFDAADLYGNLSEWTADSYKDRSIRIVFQGGHPSREEPSCGASNWYSIDSAMPEIGFRCCATPDKAPADIPVVFEKQDASVCLAKESFMNENNFTGFLASCTAPADWSLITSGARLIVVGDGTHAENAPKKEIAAMMGQFKKLGITDLGLEAVSVSQEPLINKYLNTGQGRDKLLQIFKTTLACPETADDVMAIIDQARANGITVFSTTPNRMIQDGKERNVSVNDRDHYAAQVIADILKDPGSKALVLVGPYHVWLNNLPGRSILFAGVGGVDPFRTVTVQIIGAEPEPFVYFDPVETFKFERVIRENNMGGTKFMFSTKGTTTHLSDYFIHLPQTEPFSDIDGRCSWDDTIPKAKP